MEKEYITVFDEGTGRYEEKKSRFIADVFHVSSEAEAEDRLQAVRKKYYDATHHCYAYILGKKQEISKCSDDGEPSGTAGYPILSVLQGEKLCDTLVVVTRYFGGTLLGTGGLIRSYTKAAQSGIQNAGILHKYLADLVGICTDYNSIGKIQYLMAQEGLRILSSEYGESVLMSVPVPVERTETIRKKIADLTGGKAVITAGKQIYFAEDGRELLLFED